MRNIAIKKNEILKGDYYNAEQLCGVDRFVRAEFFRTKEQKRKMFKISDDAPIILSKEERKVIYERVLDAYDCVYDWKCEKRRLHIKVRRAIFTTSRKPSYTVPGGLSLSQRLQLSTSKMDSYEFRLIRYAFIKITMKVLELSYEDFEEKKEARA